MNRISRAPAPICVGICVIRVVHLHEVHQHAFRPIAAAVITVVRAFLRRHGFPPVYHCMGSHPLLF